MSKVKNFLKNYENAGTRKNLRAAIKKYFKNFYKETTSRNLDEMAKKYFNEKRDYEKDLQDFVNSLNGMAPLTIKHKVSIIKTFFLENNVDLQGKFWKKVRRRIKGSRALTLDRIPKNKELKKILLHVPIQGKALYILLESSGMRIGEALQLNLDDLLLEENPSRISIRGEITKTGNSRHAFMSREAKEAIVEWLKVREDYMKSAVGKSHLYQKSLRIEYVDERTGETKTKLDPRVFPFDPSTAYSMWNKALHKAGLNGKDKSTGREKIHPHTLRKFFRTRLGPVIPVDIIEALMGHEGYLTEVYRHYSLEDLKKFYLKGESALLVFTEAQEVTKLRQEVEERNKTLQVLVNGLTTENLQMKSEIATVKLENTDLKRRVQRTEEKLTEIMKMLKESL
jgi:integrase